MSISEIIGLISGIALFLFGMSLMGEVLSRISGTELEPRLYRLSGNPFKGLLLGTGVTAVIQSSSATSVIVIGFVNSGMMKVRQAIPVILGAIFGTSVTGWLICLSYIGGTGELKDLLSTATLTGVIAIIGIILRMTGKNKHVGDILMGLAILMVGMSMMSGAVVGLKDQEWFNQLLVSMNSPFYGILAGLLISALLQSASAAVGVVQALSVTGGIVFDNALPLLMGISIGAALPVLIASIGTNTKGKQTAFSYLTACVLGVLAFASIYYFLDAVFDFGFADGTMNPFSLALVNSIFRLIMVAILFPLRGVIEALVTKLFPEKDTKKPDLVVLDEKFTDHPALAIEQSRTAMKDMALRTEKAVIGALGLFHNYEEKEYLYISYLETSCDTYEDNIGQFLVKLSGQEMSDVQIKDYSVLLHTLSDFERISDHAINLAKSAKELSEKMLSFSEEAAGELAVMGAAVREILSVTVKAFNETDAELCGHVEPLEEVIDGLYDTMKIHHVRRLRNGICGTVQSFLFNDCLTNFERISDHCSNIAAAVLEGYSGSFATHEYLGKIKAKWSEDFEKRFEEYSARFTLNTKSTSEE